MVVTQHIVGERYAAAIFGGNCGMRVAAALVSGTPDAGAAGRLRVRLTMAIRWAQRIQAEDHAGARAMGGDDRSHLVEPTRSETALDTEIAGVHHGHLSLSSQHFSWLLAAARSGRARCGAIVSTMLGQ